MVEDKGKGGKAAEVEGEETPPYMSEEIPEGLSNQVKWHLLKGRTKEQLVEMGYNPGTIRVSISELVKQGQLKKPPKAEKAKAEVAVATIPGTKIDVFAKGSPPEALINAMSMPVVDGELPGFEKGMKFGANLIVTGVRVAQELSAIGIQQAKPIMDMARSMREGEAMAAKNAAMEAAVMAAAQVEADLKPILASLSTGGGENPMGGMMARIMEPLLAGVVGKIVPGAQAQAPSGWQIKQE